MIMRVEQLIPWINDVAEEGILRERPIRNGLGRVPAVLLKNILRMEY